MDFNSHSHLEGSHAFLSASQYHWISYDEEKLMDRFSKHQASQRGTKLHELARMCIDLGVQLRLSPKTLNRYVNDAIGFKMHTEQVLYYSDNCYGTADAISFKKNLLRIHDYKSGESPASMKQLIIYAAIFCLEYRVNPNEIETELRLYQSDEVKVYIPEPEEIRHVMNVIVRSDEIIEEIKTGGYIRE